jgi:ABC-type dipeptide/oligopeptide/nickel transport system ATPase component
MTDLPLLRVENVSVHFEQADVTTVAVDGVSFDLHRGETLGLVGESGSGKSVTALSLLRLLPQPAGRIAGGRILLEGEDLLALSERQMRRMRGRRIAMIFQEPMTSLNPVLTVGAQIVEGIMAHQGMGRREALDAAIEMLRKVEIPHPSRRALEYPHQLSGGMRQRAMIAMALSLRPDILIADEPTTALDVTIQAQILDLIARLQVEIGMAVLMITHNLAIIAQVAERVIVMNAGKIVETADVYTLFERPAHPYTQHLLKLLPSSTLSGGCS